MSDEHHQVGGRRARFVRRGGGKHICEKPYHAGDGDKVSGVASRARSVRLRVRLLAK